MRQKKLVIALLTVIILSTSVAQVAEATPLSWLINVLQENPSASVRAGGAYTYEKEGESFIQSNESVKEFTPVSILDEELWKSGEEEIVLYKAKEIDLESGKTQGKKFYIDENSVDVYKYVAKTGENGVQRYKLNYDTNQFEKRDGQTFPPNVHVGAIRENSCLVEGETYVKVREFYTGETNWVNKKVLEVPKDYEKPEEMKEMIGFGTIVNVEKAARMKNDEGEDTGGKVHKYQTVKVLSQEDDGRVVIAIENVKGTIFHEFVKLHQYNVIGTVAEVENSVNIRSGPGLEHGVLGSKLLGSDIRVVDTVDGWYKIEIVEGVFGYVDPEFIQLPGEVTGVRVAANVREEPDGNSTKLGSIQNGTDILIISGDINGYTRISYKGRVGYISSEYIKI